jgi:hypothetical protein
MSTNSQEAQILEYLLAGNALTPLEALSKFGSFRLGARIFGLKKRGHDIDMEMVERNGKHVAQYSIKKKAGRDETHSGLLCEATSEPSHTMNGEQSRKVSLGFQGGDRNTPFETTQALS